MHLFPNQACIMGNFTFGKKEKLCSQTVIDGLFAKGESFKVFPLRVITMRVEKADANAQVLISVPKKRVRSSPGRNRIKRLIRETYRLNKPDLLEKWKREERFFAIGFVFLTNEAPDHAALNKVMQQVIAKLDTL